MAASQPDPARWNFVARGESHNDGNAAIACCRNPAQQASVGHATLRAFRFAALLLRLGSHPTKEIVDEEENLALPSANARR